MFRLSAAALSLVVLHFAVSSDINRNRVFTAHDSPIIVSGGVAAAHDTPIITTGGVQIVKILLLSLHLA